MSRNGFQRFWQRHGNDLRVSPKQESGWRNAVEFLTRQAVEWRK